jgi:hypothetical protein
MTKYVVNSGGLRHVGDQGAAFFAEIVQGLGNRPKVLLCFFAQQREDWESKFFEYQQGFADRMPSGIKPEIELALPDKFIQQIKDNDAVYIQGGDDHLLLY